MANIVHAEVLRRGINTVSSMTPPCRLAQTADSMHERAHVPHVVTEKPHALAVTQHVMMVQIVTFDADGGDGAPES